MLICHPHDLSLKRKCTSLLFKFNLKNVVDVPTRVTDDTFSLIDLIITSVPSKISSHGACNPGVSHYLMVYAALNLRGIREKPKLKRVRDFKRVDIKALQLEFAFAPWFICDVFDDIDDSVWAWEALYKYIINQHIPLRKTKVRSNSFALNDFVLEKRVE